MSAGSFLLKLHQELHSLPVLIGLPNEIAPIAGLSHHQDLT